MNVNGVTIANPSVAYIQTIDNKDVETEGHQNTEAIKQKNIAEGMKIKEDYDLDGTKTSQSESDDVLFEKQKISYEDRLKQVISLEDVQRLLLLIPPANNQSNAKYAGEIGVFFDSKS